MNTSYSGINVTQGPFFKDALLVAASVIFHTGDEDKDHDTKLTVRVQDEAGTVIAERNDVVGHWIRKSSCLVPLDLKNAPIKENIANGTVHLQITPNGRKLWNFDYELWFFFSGEPCFSAKWTGKCLTDADLKTSDSWSQDSSD